VAVEAALITPILITLVFGIVDFSLLLKDYVGAVSATRAGARTASAEPHQTSFLTDTAAQMTRATANLNRDSTTSLWIYRVPGGSSGAPPATCNADANCVPFSWNGTAFVSADLGNWPASAVNACPLSATNPSGPDAVGVRLTTPHNFLTPIWKGSFTIDDKAVLNFEPVPLGVSGTGCAAS